MKKNFSLNFAYQLLSIGISLITTPYIARVLGAEKSGMYSYSYAIANYFLLFAMLGINNYGNRCIAFDRDDKQKRSKTFSELYSLQVTISLAVILVYSLYIIFLAKYKALAIIQIIYLLSATFDINWFYFGMEKFSLTVSRNAIIKILLTIGIFLFVKTKQDLYLYTVFMALSQLLSNLILHFFLKKYVDFKWAKLSELKLHIKPLLVLFIPVLAISIYNIMDKIMLGYLGSATAVGYYDYSERIMQIPNAFITAVGTVMLPRMSHMAKTNSIDVIKTYINKSMNIIMFFAIGMTFGIAGVAKNLIPLFLGSEYTECIFLVQLLTPIIAIKAWANVIRTQYLIPYCKDTIYVISVSLGALANFIINLMLIPKYNAIGAVIGTIIAEIVVMLIQTICVRTEIGLKNNLMKTLLFIASGLLMYLVIITIQNNSTGSIICLLIECLVGGGIYVLLGAITNHALIKELIHEKGITKDKIK